MSNPQPAQLRRERATGPAQAEPEPTIRCWGIVYVPYTDGPGGGYRLHEMHVPVSAVEEYTARTWAPDLMSITTARLGSRVHASTADPDSADRDTF